MNNEQFTILVVEDDDATRTFLADNLTADGYKVLVADHGRRAQRLIATQDLDLVVLDLTLPECPTLEKVRSLTGALIVTLGRTAPDSGWADLPDDWVTKPFSYPELRSRIAALLKGVTPATAFRLRVGPLEILPLDNRVLLRGEPVDLTPKEYRVLRTLSLEPTRVFTKEEIIRDVWGDRVIGSTRALDSAAVNLRKKLGVEGDRLVVNVWGVGYRLVDAPISA